MAVELTWLGRTGFRIRGREGAVVCDPPPASSGFKPGKPTADVVTLSRRDDPEMGDPQIVAGSPRVLNAPGEYEVGGVLVNGVAMERPDGGRDVAFLIQLEGLRICHLGAMSAAEKPVLPEELDDIDVLLLPVGNGPALSARQAFDLMTKVDPGIVIPMFYKTEQERMDIEPLDTFLGETGTRPEAQTRFQVTKASLPDALTVVVLQPRAG
jgi:L-ascorbate metabolism protein UlaG (beta-lactamase superfamily)